MTAVGNDYNDLDLLNWAGQAFAVLNAPLQIRKRFRTVPANNDCGLTRAVTMAGLL